MKSKFKLKPLDCKGVKFRTFISFFTLAGIILALLWLLQVVFLNTFYQSMQKREVEAVAEKIVSAYGTDGFVATANELTFENEVSVVVFKLTDTPMPEIVYASAGRSDIFNNGLTDNAAPNPDNRETPPPSMSFAPSDSQKNALLDLANKLSTEETVSYVSSREGHETLTYGQVISYDGEPIYFYVNASLALLKSTSEVLKNQLLIITVICLVITLSISAYFSYRLSAPLIKVTQTAEKLAKGNLDVKFDGDGYSEITRLSDTLNYATAELKKTEALRKDVIANVSHELRTPLTMIKAYAELIRDISGGDKEKREKHLSVILQETDRLKTLVDDVLDLSKIQAGILQYDFVKCDLSSLVKKQASNFEGLFAANGFTFDIQADDNIFINADINRIEQVVFNLISNAINYSTDDLRIAVRLHMGNGSWKLEVEDHGVGIAPEEIDTVFDRFFRTEQAKRTASGSGIGLSLVKEILLAHGFDYGALSEQGKGSIFYCSGKLYE